jgi:hypothetical protein
MTDQELERIEQEKAEALRIFLENGGGNGNVIRAVAALHMGTYHSWHAAHCLQEQGYFPIVISSAGGNYLKIITFFTEEVRILHLKVRRGEGNFPDLVIPNTKNGEQAIGEYVRDILAPREGIKRITQEYPWNDLERPRPGTFFFF